MTPCERPPVSPQRRGLSRAVPWFVAPLLLASAGFGQDSSIPYEDTYCGPRAVHRILKWYGIHEELITIIRESQWPQVEDGARLSDLVESLNQRGIHSKAICLPVGYSLHWEEPVIVHEPHQDLGGHYYAARDVVNGDVRLESGVSDFRETTLASLGSDSSLTILLTSRRAITDRAVKRALYWRHAWWAWTALAIACTVLASSYFLARRNVSPLSLNVRSDP